MEPKPVQESPAPRYPTRRDVLAGAAALALFNLLGCAHRTALGCVAVTPPVYLSEEEAMQVIREELAGYGVDLRSGTAINAIRIVEKFLEVQQSGAGNRQTAQLQSPRPSGVDPETKVVVEFVAYPYRRWPPNRPDFSKVMGHVAGRPNDEPVYLGLLDRPQEFIGHDENRERIKANLRQALSVRARDFAAWLKQQKVIQ